MAQAKKTGETQTSSAGTLKRLSMPAQSLVSLSRLYLIQLLAARGPMTLIQLGQAAPRAENGRRMTVEIGRGSAVVDYVRFMQSEGMITGNDKHLELTPLGQRLVAKMARADVAERILATP